MAVGARRSRRNVHSGRYGAGIQQFKLGDMKDSGWKSRSYQNLVRPLASRRRGAQARNHITAKPRALRKRTGQELKNSPHPRGSTA